MAEVSAAPTEKSQSPEKKLGLVSTVHEKSETCSKLSAITSRFFSSSESSVSLIIASGELSASKFRNFASRKKLFQSSFCVRSFFTQHSSEHDIDFSSPAENFPNTKREINCAFLLLCDACTRN